MSREKELQEQIDRLRTGMEAFLYILIRDELPFGTVNGIIRNHVQRALKHGRPKYSCDPAAAIAFKMVCEIEGRA